MAIKIESPRGESALTEFVRFHDRVYEYRTARWPSQIAVQLPLLLGEGPFAVDRKVCPFAAIDNGQIVARAVALIDGPYQRHWHEKLGHIVMFEAMPESRHAVRLLIDEASSWLKSRGATVARTGYGLLEFPYVIDDYETLPPDIARQNPPYYHSLLKDAGFESERGWVDYKIKVTPELIARYESALESCRRAGFAIIALKDVPASRRLNDFEPTWNQAFSRHWGMTPFSRDEMLFLLDYFSISGGLDTSVIAYKDGVAVGALMVTPPSLESVILKPGRTLGDHEKLNFLGIGVLEAGRGRGVNLAMAAYSYLHLIRNGSKYLSYTLVLDDNWPSRRTAEKLGAKICANYLTYRRTL